MLSKIDQLIQTYDRILNEPWSTALSGQERVWFVVYDPAEQRKIDFRMGDFETATKKAGKKWAVISMKQCFAEWMSKHEYREDYFADPELIVDQLEASFIPFAISYLKGNISALSTDDNTVIAIKDVASLFGFLRLSELLKSCDKEYTGRLLIFFPGEFENNQYRLLDARDGWGYLARPITV
jgi:hypothetical protein